MNKKKAARRKERKKQKRLNEMVFFSAVAIMAYAWSVYLFINDSSCTYGGTKLAIFIAPLCHFFGNKGIALLPLVLGMLFSVQLWSTYKR